MMAFARKPIAHESKYNFIKFDKKAAKWESMELGRIPQVSKKYIFYFLQL